MRGSRVQERVIAAPDINEPFGANFLTTGLSQQQATDLVRQLKSGALAAPMDFVEEYVIGPSLGAENVNRGIKAVVFSFLFTLGFFTIYYRMFGLITSVALLFNLLIVVAVMSLFGATMTLPGFAGLALSVGLSVDANGKEVRGSRVQERVIAAPDINEPFGANFLTTGLSQQQATDLVRQ
ncbi:MAG: protein translocase subunit SecD, partial [Xanthomonadales bacterium]|nr:protein translocase subunit SecD [Xanthomonadales bacterium]